MKKEYHPHRKIYEQHHGPIPVDEDDRTYDIHHIDGNRANNDINNLMACPIREHYDIHYEQGDWAACLLLTRAMNVSPEEKSRLLSLHNQKLIKQGKHPFQNSEKQRERQLIKVKNNEHHWQKPEHSERITKWNLERSQKKIHPWNDGEKQRKRQISLVEKGEHHWQNKENASLRSKNLIKEGNHNFQKEGFYENMAEKRAKEYKIEFPNGEVKTIKNLNKFCRENYLHKGLMRKVLQGHQKSHKGYSKG